ncbi:MAG: porin, partial [Verrucomicrobiota bacterium]
MSIHSKHETITSPKHAFHCSVALKAAMIIPSLTTGSLQAGTSADSLGLASGVPEQRVVADPAAANSPYVPSDNLCILYQNRANPILEMFGFAGELQLQYANGESNHGSFGSKDIPSGSRWDGIDVRRWRVGFLSEWFDVFKFFGNVDINPQVNPFYKDIYDLTLTYAPDDAFNLSLGKTKARWFSQEYDTRTRELVIFEQALLVNALVPQQLTGAWITGRTNHWIYALAGFAGDYATEFSRFSKGAVIQANLGVARRANLGESERDKMWR